MALKATWYAGGMSSDEFVNIHGLARILQLPCKWLEAEANAGRLPCLRIGNRFRFSVEAVRAALAEQAATVAIEDGASPKGEITNAT